MKKLLLPASIVLAILGCGGDMDDNMPCLTCKEAYPSAQSSSSYILSSSSLNKSSSSSILNSSSLGGSSSSSVPSSSSSEEISSSSAKCPDTDSGTFTDHRDGKTYSYVKICYQTWMAENLNYNSGSSSSSGSACYDNEASNCAIYGRLYDWPTAMAVCPFGWHLPIDSEWDILLDHAGDSSTAGTKLKAVNGWIDDGNGTDDYGFSAMPGGFGSSNGNFYNAGGYGSWWVAAENDNNRAHYRYIYSYDDNINGNYDSKSNLFSVRCLKD